MMQSYISCKHIRIRTLIQIEFDKGLCRFRKKLWAACSLDNWKENG